RGEPIDVSASVPTPAWAGSPARRLAPASARAVTSNRSATWPCGTNDFDPSSIQASPLRRADVQTVFALLQGFTASAIATVAMVDPAAIPGKRSLQAAPSPEHSRALVASAT